MVLPNKAYDILKWLMLLLVPLATFIVSVIDAFATGDPKAIIMATFSGLTELIGIIIKVSDTNFKKQALPEGK